MAGANLRRHIIDEGTSSTLAVGLSFQNKVRVWIASRCTYLTIPSRGWAVSLRSRVVSLGPLASRSSSEVGANAVNGRCETKILEELLFEHVFPAVYGTGSADFCCGV